jgi:hypothetical protein
MAVFEGKAQMFLLFLRYGGSVTHHVLQSGPDQNIATDSSEMACPSSPRTGLCYFL